MKHYQSLLIGVTLVICLLVFQVEKAGVVHSRSGGFYERFTTTNNWKISKGYGSSMNGIFYINGSASYWNGTYFDKSRFSSLDYSVRMRRTGCSSCNFGVLVRTSNLGFYFPGYWAYGMWLTINNEGYFRIWKTMGRYEQQLVYAKYAPKINKNNWNVLRVRAKGNSYQFFINGTKVSELYDSSFSAGHVGVQQYSGSYYDQLLIDTATLTVP